MTITELLARLNAAAGHIGLIMNKDEVGAIAAGVHKGSG